MLLYLILIVGGVGLLVLLLKLASGPSPGKALKRRIEMVKERHAEGVTAAAQAQIEAERQSALVSLRGEVGSLAIDLASGVVGEVLTDDKKAQAIVDRFLADLESSEKAQKAGSSN